MEYYQKFKEKQITAMIALKYDCQCKCPHCGSESFRVLSAEKKSLSSQEIFLLLEKLKAVGVFEIYFFGGEPLLNKNLSDYIEFANRHSLKTKLDSNGLLLDQKMILDLKNRGLDEIGISLDSPLPEEHDQLRGVPGLFKKAIVSIKYCQKYALSCYISHCVSRDSLNNGKLGLLLRMAADLKVRTRLLLPAISGKLTGRADLILTAEELSKFYQYLCPGLVFWEGIDSLADVSRVCSAREKKYFYISAAGDIAPCCYVPIIFGNVRKENLNDILAKMWMSELFNDKSSYCLANSKYILQKSLF